ncbi:MAG: PAS domain S-box protein [Gammaproteobacteria bacterium]|nr:PAS domain S-box protein [Gammaproteobacteria bacterium]
MLRGLHDITPVHYFADVFAPILALAGALTGYYQDRVIFYARRLEDLVDLRTRDLRRSEQRYALAVDGSNDGIWDWDLKSASIFFSPRWKQMLGYELDDIDNNFMTWRDLVHPDDLGRFLVLWTDYMDGQSESFFIEYRIRRKAGDYAWVLCRGSSLRDEVGHIVRLSGSQTDITERHQADSKLRLQTSALTAADDGIVITDREGNIQWVNRAYTRLTGYELDEVLGKNPRILKSGKHNQIFYKKMWDTILGGKTWHGELWNKRKDGGLYLEEERITPVLGQGGEVGHFIAIKRDITDRKSIEEELVRFKSTLDKTLDCVFMFEPESLKFFYVNQGAMEQVGYSHEDLMQMTPVDIKPKFDEAKFRKLITPLIDGPVHTATFETIHQHKDGHHISVEISLQYVFPKGEPPRFVAFVRDITERQQLQKQLQQAQKMEAIGQLTGGIAHDFNNMLSGVLGFTELAREELAQYDNEKIEGYLSQVYNSGSRARDLVAQMLAFSRGGEGKLEPFMLSPLIKESLKMLGSTLPSSIEVDLQLEGDDLIVMTNPVQLHQLVMNLCINARDAMDGKGHITIGLQRVNSIVTECCSCHERVRGDYIELFFRDTGPGIQPEQMDRLFDPFYTTKDVGKGTGMGLSMVHGIMHDHGGHVLVESGPGKGTTFALLFPVIDVQVDTVNMEGNDANAKSEQVLDGNILIVDDEISVGGFIGELLKGHGCQVTVETDSKLALSRFRGNPEAFDLVITDQTMPGMTGAELAQSLIAIRPELPVILCTGYSEHLDAVGAEAIGIRGYVNKPIEIDGFLGLVKELLQDREISV